ncbi:hypothetical protein D3C76_1822460 [compost metagenome]
MEQPLQHMPPLHSLKGQEFRELTLGQHHRSGKILHGQTQNLLNPGIHLFSLIGQHHGTGWVLLNEPGNALGY